MRRRTVALILLCAACGKDTPTLGPAEFVASVTVDYDLGFFGGLSGLELGPDGRDATLLLDTGALIVGTLHRDTEGRPAGLRQWRLVPIEEPPDAGLGVRGLDTEGLAVSSEGIFVSLERVHAVWRISPEGEVEARLPQHPDFPLLDANASLEALAVDREGALYTLPERSGGTTEPFPVWRYADGRWTRAGEVARRGRFLPVGADFGPDGALYLLERRFQLPFGFATRVRRFEMTDGGLVEGEALLETAVGTHDNLEGLAVWSDAAGDIRLTMVSDDNNFRLQQTEIVEYRVPAALAASTAAR